MLAVGQTVLARCTAKTEGMKSGASQGHTDDTSFAARARSALGTVLRGPLTGFVDEDGCAWEGTSSSSPDGDDSSSGKRNPLSDKDDTTAAKVSDIYEVEFVLTAGDIGASSKTLTGGKGGKGGKQASTNNIVVTVKELMQRQFIVSPALPPETLAALEKMMGEEATRSQKVKLAAAPTLTPTQTSTPSLEQLAKQASVDKGQDKEKEKAKDKEKEKGQDKDKDKDKDAVAATNIGAAPTSTSTSTTAQPAATSQGLSGKGQAPAPTEVATKPQVTSKDASAAGVGPAAAGGAVVSGSAGTVVAAKASDPPASGAPKDKPPQPKPQPESDLVREFFVARVPTCATTLLTLQPPTPSAADTTTLSQTPQSSRSGTSNASSSSKSAIVNPTTAAGLYCIGQLCCLKTVNSASGKDPSLNSSSQVWQSGDSRISHLDTCFT